MATFVRKGEINYKRGRILYVDICYVTVCVIVGILKRVDPYIVVTVCVIVGILKRIDPYIVVTVCVIVGILKRVDPYIVVTVCANNNISFISWRSVLLVEEIGVPGENHRPAASH